MIVLQLRSADPNGENKGTEVVEVVKKVAEAIDLFRLRGTTTRTATLKSMPRRGVECSRWSVSARTTSR